VPRWGFASGWDDYMNAVRAELARRHVRFDDEELRGGVISLPEPADYEAWDLREITTRCRDLEPNAWDAELRARLAEALGEAWPSAAAHDDAPEVSSDPPLERAHLRVQWFHGDLAAKLSEHVASRPLGDVATVLVADLGIAEHTLTWPEIERLGLSGDEAFALARAQSGAVMASGIHTQQLGVPGALAEVLVANGFFLGGAFLELHARMDPGLPIVVAPISWHHIVAFTLQADANRETLAHMRELVAKLADGITTVRNATAWLTRSLWWWPSGAAEPVVLGDQPDQPLPADLAARLAG